MVPTPKSIEKYETAEQKKAKSNKDDAIIELLTEIRDHLDANFEYRK